ncbi:hypothetical protein [Streptacidiphilus melanogenes]|uniref:hypothetical protein n=1 Tax=Streptacidiphilus melanogenes TaxID=411235 RepID=UPI000693A63C|nr:hypothetical protein [Streptacidiphilus melanogenes]
MSIKRKFARGAAVAALGVSAVIAGSGAAFAGTNGQQIEFFDNIGNTGSVAVYGTNQAGQPARHCFDTPVSDNRFGGWWWEGSVTLYEYSGPCSGGYTTGSLVETQTVNVPQAQSGSDWWAVNNYAD